MQFSNYPAGVTDSHPHFNPNERPVQVACSVEDATVVPSHVVKQALKELAELMERIPSATAAYAPSPAAARKKALEKVKELQEQIEKLEDVSDFACPFEGELELPVSEEAEWVCPVCGQTRTSDTLPEEDPDRAREEHEDMMYEERRGN
jgi:rubrerythrin